MANLITLAEYKSLVGVATSNTRDDALVEALIPAASLAIEKYTDRRFGVGYGATPRSFQYDGSGILDIDDCTGVTAVTSDGGVPGGPTYSLTASEYTAMPYRETSDDDPHYYLILHTLPRPYSPQMGFRNNLDTLDILDGQPVIITVTATWGWPAVPDDVKLATAWTIQDAARKPDSSAIRSEAIEGFSRSFQDPAKTGSLALPSRARDLLNNYIRVFN